MTNEDATELDYLSDIAEEFTKLNSRLETIDKHLENMTDLISMKKLATLVKAVEGFLESFLPDAEV